MDFHGRGDRYEASVKGLIVERIQANAILRTGPVCGVPAVRIRFDMTCDKHLRQRAAGNKAPAAVRGKDRLLKEVPLTGYLAVIGQGGKRLCSLQGRRVKEVKTGKSLRLKAQRAPVVLELLVDQSIGFCYVLESRGNLRVYTTRAFSMSAS